MKDTERKALRIVLADRVTVEHATFDKDGRIGHAHGTVEGDNGTYTVTVDGDTATCTCRYGEARENASGHSHDLALRLQAQQEGEPDGS